MVPVRKPGRPLSQCPHPKDQRCGCGSVTAAIPRKQACHCGTSTPPMSSGQATPQDSEGSTVEPPSPSKSTFKVQKTTSRPQSSRKQSFDPVNFERMDMNNINIIPYEQRPQAIPPPFANGYALPDSVPPYGYAPQFTSYQTHFGHMMVQPPPHIYTGISGLPNGFQHEKRRSLENVIESPLTPTESTSSGPNGVKKAGSCCAPLPPTKESNGAANGGSCCAPKQPSHSHTSSSASSISEPQEVAAGSCYSSKPAPSAMKREPNMTPQMPSMFPPNGMPFNPAVYPQYLPQTTVFTYPPTYGSFQNPLQPSAWRQSVLANSYGHPQMQVPPPASNLPYDTRVVPESLDTVHTCGCGDGCQCVGCAAHPYNNATQDYVRSAWSSMNMEAAPAEVFTNGHANGNGHAVPNGDLVPSPTASHTPSSTTSGTGEEQSLSAADFFFVNYPFSSEEGCGGDTASCPCGDDCQCLGCTIHQQPPPPCEGQGDSCPCGDDCQCIGCEIHGNTKV